MLESDTKCDYLKAWREVHEEISSYEETTYKNFGTIYTDKETEIRIKFEKES